MFKKSMGFTSNNYKKFELKISRLNAINFVPVEAARATRKFAKSEG
jgi:hypothetical protein